MWLWLHSYVLSFYGCSVYIKIACCQKKCFFLFAYERIGWVLPHSVLGGCQVCVLLKSPFVNAGVIFTTAATATIIATIVAAFFLLNLVVNLHLHVIKFVCSLQSITRKIGHTTYKWMQIYTIKQYECEYYYSPQTRTWIHNFYCRRVLLRLHLLIRKNIYNIKIHSNKNFEWNLKFV